MPQYGNSSKQIYLISLPAEVVVNPNLSPAAKLIAAAIIGNGIDRGCSYRSLFKRSRECPAKVAGALAELEVSKLFVSRRIINDEGVMENRIFYRTSVRLEAETGGAR